MAKGRKKKDTAANIGFEQKLWAAADKMRGPMDAADHKHVALGLILLKCISDALLDVLSNLLSRETRVKTLWRRVETTA